MKKALWGYNIHEVDENMDYLETQNIKLEKQVKQLSAELEKAKTELEFSTADSGSLEAVKEECDRTINGLRAELVSAKTAYTQLKAENEKLSSEIARKDAESSEQSEVFAEVGNICRLAYEDMHHTKQKTRETLESFLASFWTEWKKYQQQVCSLSEQIKLQQEESRKSFIESADRILQSYGGITQQNQLFDTGLSDIMETSEKLQSELESLLAELDDESETEAEEEPFPETASGQTGENVLQEKIDTYSILRAIQTLSERRGISKAQDSKAAVEEESHREETLPERKEDKTESPIGNVNEEFSISHKVNVRDII